MNRLVGFGCSFTYGHGLEDCFVPPSGPGHTSSKFSWVNCLGTMLDKEPINLARPGSSNLEILYKVLNFDFHETDTVVILWTDVARDLIWKQTPDYEGDLNFQPIGTWMTKEDDKVDIESWLLLHNDFDLVTRSWYNVHHAECFLEYKKIKNLSFFVNADLMFRHYPQYMNFKNTSNIDISPFLFNQDKALDHKHPGPNAHKKFAEFVCELLND